MSAHTPGPWKPMWTGRGKMVFHHVSATAPAISGFCGERAVEIASISGIDPQTDAANARLVAASPELLEALISVEALFGHLATDSTQVHWLDRTRAAISKATGGAA